jgi:hypothetical protein
MTLTAGISGFFKPNPLAFLGLHVPLPVDAAGYYSTHPLEATKAAARRGVASPTRRLKPNSPAYSRRPEPIGRPSSSPARCHRSERGGTSASGFRSAPSPCPIVPVLDASMFEARFRPNQALRLHSVRRFTRGREFLVALGQELLRRFEASRGRPDLFAAGKHWLGARQSGWRGGNAHLAQAAFAHS